MPARMPIQKPGRSKQNRATPQAFIDATCRALNIAAFSHDFAATRANAKASSYWGLKDDSLSMPSGLWAEKCLNGWGWLNPPFGNIEPWAYLCKWAAAFGGHIAFLVPASVGANWFRRHVHEQAYVLLLNGRLDFIPGKPYPKDCMLCLYGLPPGYRVWSWRTERLILPTK